MIILCDMDEVLVNLVDKWCYYHRNRYGSNIYREDLVNYGQIHTNDWLDFLRIPGFHADLPWLDPEAPKVLRRLKVDGHRLVVATSPASWEAPRDKYSWCHTHLRIPGLIDSMDDIMIGRDKSLLRGDVLIDDNPAHLDSFKGTTIVYDQPWNRKYDKADYRVTNWSEVERVILELEYSRIHSNWLPTGCV